MRLLAASSPRARGQDTDAQAEVGLVSLSGSLGVAAFGVGTGMLVGLVYLLARRVLPASLRGRSLLFAVFSAAGFGAGLVLDHGSFDFSRLGPQWLSVSAFVLMPGLVGLLTVYGYEAAAASARVRRQSTPRLVSAALVLGLGGAVLLLPVLAVAGLALLLTRFRVVRTTWRQRWVTVAGRVAFVTVIVVGVWDLTLDVISIVTDVPR